MIELDTHSTGARIRVIGVGGGGGNAINSMILRGLTGVDFISANTDFQALQNNLAPIKIQVGKETTRGLGAGGRAETGQRAMEESIDELRQVLSGSDMIFVTAGMGGGSGTGGAPTVARIGKELGALVVGIVTKPFKWESTQRSKTADSGIDELRKFVDALIVIPNQKLLSVIDKKTTMIEAFRKVDDVLHNATRGIADIITGHGLINVDFADVRTIMTDMGDALMGTGIARGEHRAMEAAQNAISSPLLEGVSIGGAQGVLINITASSDVTMFEIAEAVQVIEESAGSDTNLIHGVVLDDEMGDTMMVTVVATGFRRNAEGKLVATHAGHEQTVNAAPKTPAHNAPTVIGYGSSLNNGGGQYTQAQQPRQNVTPPSGTEELKQYDTPAIWRQQQQAKGGALRIPNNNPNHPQPDNANNLRDTRERPAFLRKIMD